MEAQTERVATQPVEGQVLTPDWVKEAVFYHMLCLSRREAYSYNILQKLFV